jgi:hypothetical protein
VVKALQDRINDLEARLQMRETSNVPVVETRPESTPNDQPAPANLQKEAEEVGFLTTGGSDLYSGSKYGKLVMRFTPDSTKLMVF